jgi:hypothetical protein
MSRISNYRAADLLCSAFEGGSNYWYMINDYVEPEEVTKPWGEDEYHPGYISFPFSSGGAVLIGDLEDEEADEMRLDKKAIAQGKRIMEEDEQYSHHFADVLNENDDACTGDVFLQLCLFGEVIYG